MQDLEIERIGSGMTRHFARDDAAVADQEQPDRQTMGRHQRAGDDRVGGVIAAHRVNRDSKHHVISRADGRI